jgi:hypothetical protein
MAPMLRAATIAFGEPAYEAVVADLTETRYDRLQLLGPLPPILPTSP